VAVALAQRGMRVGLLDADVYGPSCPTLLGLSGRAEATADTGRIEPRERYGVKLMSLDFLMPPGHALIWRGSLVDEGLPQLFSDVDWGERDLLLVDLPPGTSDVHLAVTRHVALSGVVAVTSPGQVSVQDVRRGMEMFADLAVPCLGLVENMTAVHCQRCDHVVPLFGTNGGEALAEDTGIPLLARIPFVPALVASSDAGTPVVVADPHSPAAVAFKSVAGRMVESLGLRPAQEARA
jgi:ATP-binding protein involved in chromosome partitioning